MAALVSIFVILIASLLFTRIATVALTATGLSRQVAHFQSRSAFFGVGFTTSETESAVNHPVRRRIILAMMLLGNAGIVGAVASLALSFAGTNGSETAVRLLTLAGGLILLWALVANRWVDRWLSRMIAVALRRWTDLDVRDYASLLQLTGEYEVMELAVEPDDWMADRALAELKLRDEGVVVLGINRANGAYVGAPTGESACGPGTTWWSTAVSTASASSTSASAPTAT